MKGFELKAYGMVFQAEVVIKVKDFTILDVFKPVKVNLGKASGDGGVLGI
jgi:hypothetical protein